MSKCDAYHIHKRTRYLDPATIAHLTGKCPKNNGAYEEEYGVCWGTREQDVCSCGGDRTLCDFYPEVREKAKTEINLDETVRILGSLPVQSSPAECGEAINKFGKWFLSLTDEEKHNIVVDYFSNPPTEDDKQAIREFAMRHPDADALRCVKSGIFKL